MCKGAHSFGHVLCGTHACLINRFSLKGWGWYGPWCAAGRDPSCPPTRGHPRAMGGRCIQGWLINRAECASIK